MDTRRNRLRWRHFDYATARAYYVTICVHQRRCVFGDVVDGSIELNAAGMMVADQWRSIESRWPGVRVHDFVVMPNHIHAILVLQGATGRAGVDLSGVVGWFKSATTLRYADGVRRHGWPRFDRHLWQRSFHDRVLRDDAEREHATGYIWRNPGMWREDPLHPALPPGAPLDVPWA